MKTKSLIVVLIIALVVISGIAYTVAVMPKTQSAPKPSPAPAPQPAPSATVAFPVALTDPPSVPAGTTALWLNYTGVELITNSSPLFMNASGSVNLLKLVNVSDVIAVFRIPEGAVVNQVRLFVSSAEIVINGATYPVFLPSGVLKIPINNATQGALVDLQPHIVVAQVGQTPEYILTPVVTALPYNVSATPGAVEPLPLPVIHKLSEVFSNLTIVSASLSTSGSETAFSITLKNNGNAPVVLYAVRVYGEWLTTFSMKFNITILGNETMMAVGGIVKRNGTVVFLAENNSLEPLAFAPFGGSALESIGNMTHINFEEENVFNFTPARFIGSAGVTIMPGQEVTLTFNGTIAPVGSWKMKPPFRGVAIYTEPVAGLTYNITLVSAPPSRAEISATAY